MAEDGLGGYFEQLLEDGREIPEPAQIKGENIPSIKTLQRIARSLGKELIVDIVDKKKAI
jgi:hypothetical protein